MEKIVVKINNVIMHNTETGFIIFNGDNLINNKTCSVKGLSVNITEDNLVECSGFWKDNIKYGLQFEAKEIVLYKPDSIDRIKLYLKSETIKGITKRLAEKIILEFGDNLLYIMNEEPEKIGKISGVGKKRLDTIIESWKEHKDLYDGNEELKELGFSFEEAIIISHHFGENIREIYNNPYILLQTDKLNIDFKKIDSIAINKLRIKKDNEIRILSYFVYLINEEENFGNSYILKNDLLKKAYSYLNVDNDFIDLILEAGHISNNIVVSDNEIGSIVQNYETYLCELSIAKKINNIKNNQCKSKKILNIDKKIKYYESNGITLSKGQKKAIKDCMLNNINIINGGPGVGKTTTLDIFLKLIKDENYTFSLSAYTGKASKRIKESTSEDASTIHKLLEYNPALKEFNKNKYNFLEVDFLIIDETSMVDLFIFNKILDALDMGTTLILIGDVDQIPSISLGAILRDLIESNAINVSYIDELQRVSKNSNIIKNSYKINEGKMIDFENNKNSDFFFIKTSNDKVTLDKIKEMISFNIPKSYNVNISKDIQILTPVHENYLGRKNLNKELQNIINPRKSDNEKFIQKGDIKFYIGDNVIQTKNNYDDNIMNGDCGVVEDISFDGMYLRFGDDLIFVSKSALFDIELAFSITMHKSQGSEYPVVIIPISHYKNRVIDRSLLYTAMTRGKMLVIIIGSLNELENIIKNDYSRNRKTNLKKLLIDNVC